VVFFFILIFVDMKASINTYVECSKSSDMGTTIRQYCIDCGITIHKLECVPIYSSLLGKVFGMERETIYFHIEGDLNHLENFKRQLKELAKD
jgi:hypothetical protein